MIPISRRRCPRQDASTQIADARGCRFDPPCVLRLRIADQRRAEDAVLLNENDAPPRLRRLKRGAQSSRASTHNEYITKCRALRKSVGVSACRWFAKACGFPDEIFVEHPALGRSEEGFVVETGGQEARHQAEHRADIERQTWPAVLACRDQSFVNEHIGRACIRFGASAFADSDKRVGLFNPRRHDPARAVIFEAAADKTNAIPQQRCGQRIVFACAIGFAVESEVDHGNASGPTARIASIL